MTPLTPAPVDPGRQRDLAAVPGFAAKPVVQHKARTYKNRYSRASGNPVETVIPTKVGIQKSRDTGFPLARE